MAEKFHINMYPDVHVPIYDWTPFIAVNVTAFYQFLRLFPFLSDHINQTQSSKNNPNVFPDFFFQ